METLTPNSVISTIKNFNNEHGNIRSLLKNFWSEANTMAIKQNQHQHENATDSYEFVYTPIKQPPPKINHRVSMTEAKRAFLNSTVNSTAASTLKAPKENPALHYAQLAMVTDNDSRSTGGGKLTQVNSYKNDNKENTTYSKCIEQKRVSFKVKQASTSYRKPPISTKTVTITNTKVSELTKKFNSLIEESNIKPSIQSNIIKVPSIASSPSSTLSSSPIKIVLRQKRGNRRRGKKKRCCSMDDIENTSTSSKTSVARSKSDGVKFRKTKRKLKYESSEPNSGTDSNESNSSKVKHNKRAENKIKNVIKKFEFEIIAQTNPKFNTIKAMPEKKKDIKPITEKPKVPEKKSTLALTKNVVVKDGVPKIRLLRPTARMSLNPEINKKSTLEVPAKKKEQTYDKLKYKTNYIHSDKLPLKAVEIIHEDINESTVCNVKNLNNISTKVDSFENKEIQKPINNEKVQNTCENMNSNWNEHETHPETNIIISPNNSFLWRRNSVPNIYEDNLMIKKNQTNGSPIYERINVNNNKSENYYQYNKTVINIDNADFESDLVEAVNKVLVDDGDDDYYEPLSPRDVSNVIVIPVRTVDRKSKINCPLPEIPKEQKPREDANKNDYQCLLEMRSHPEGDDSSLHNYEDCESSFEERTRGDGDSDDGYEYCKTQVKPYCLMSSTGIQIAESYTPMPPKPATMINKSSSNASEVSYEQIGAGLEHYDGIQINQHHESSPSCNKNWPSHSSSESNITVYNDNENIYDTVKLSDGTSHNYESVPSSPSVAKMRQNLRKQLTSAVRKRFSMESASTVTSDQRTNSIYGQRSVRSYNGQDVGFAVPSSESGSDRSDDWVDLSDDEKQAQYGEHKIIIVQERARGKKSPLSWSQKVRHQWQKQPANVNEDHEVFVTSPTKVHILTCEKSPFFSRNDELVRRIRSLCSDECDEAFVRVIDVKHHDCWIKVVTSFQDGEVETQENVTFIESDASDFGHVYESLGPPLLPAPAPPALPPPVPPAPFDEDFDSFDSDSDFDDSSHPISVSEYKSPSPTVQPPNRLPTPPSGGQYTLIKIANAAQRKMRQIKRNLTKKYANGVDGLPKPATTTGAIYDSFKNLYKSTYKSPPQTTFHKQEDLEHTYSNLEILSKGEAKKTDSPPKPNGFKEELMTVLGEKIPENSPPPRPSLPSPGLIERFSAEKPDSPNYKPDSPNYKPDSPNQKPDSPPQLGRKDKDPGTLRKIKSRFRRAASVATDMDADIPSVLKITNSTFYLTDSMDSGFSNCVPRSSDSAGSPRSPAPPRPAGSTPRHWSESSPCLALPRPAVPPPPPPTVNVNVNVNVTPPPPEISAVNEELKRLLPTLRKEKDKERRSRTSWYAEAGDLQIGNSSWYSEIGLYPVGNISSSSGASSGSHPASPLPRTLFPHEPLYQFYTAAKVESQCREGDSDSEAYEGVCPPRSSAMALVAPRGPARTLWCEVPEVRASTVLSSLAPTQKRLQEAKFELLTSEASYLNSLNVLESHFIAHPAFRDTSILSREDREVLFGTILPVKKCSQLLMNELEKCWQENILLTGICDIVRKHAESHFHVYVKYCENQALMVRALQRLRGNVNFANTLRRLESHPQCQSLSLHSFLMLPMQRVTRLPLLLDAVLRHLAAADAEHDACLHALAQLNHYVSQCNEGARNTERVEEMFRLAAQIEFPPHIQNAPVIGPAMGRRDRKPVRWLVRSGEMTQLVWKADELKLTFGKKFHKIPLHLFLFNDLLLITKRRSSESYTVVDWCWRSLLAVSGGDVATAKHALLLTLLEDCRGRTQEMLMSCGSETCVSRWVEALTPCASDGGDAVYGEWDCPQVHALYCYAAAQPDELSLEQGDVVNVTRKTSEGWYYGERTRDGAAGWFPGAYTAEVMSPHVRARNLRQRYRLLALSGTYLGHRKKT